MSNNNQPFDNADEMQPEYDFSGKVGVRGKYYRAYQQGYTIRIQQADGTVVEESVIPPPRTVVLDPDM